MAWQKDYEVTGNVLGGYDKFIKLLDTPSSYTAGYLVSVNSAGDAIEFISPSSVGATTFIGLTDTPSAFTAGYAVRANSSGDALEFFDQRYGEHFSSTDEITSITYSGDTITQIVYASGRTINYTYDTGGKLLSKNDGTYEWVYTYDADGKLTSTTVTKL